MSLRATERFRIETAPPAQKCGTPSESVRFEEQRDTKWCWAACVRMVVNAYNISSDSQCRIAERALSPLGMGITCCTSTNQPINSGSCNQTLKDRAITKLWEKYSVAADYKYRTSVPNVNDLVTELKKLLKNGPVQLGYTGIVGHVVLLYGCETPTGGPLTFLVHDPANGSKHSVVADAIVTLSGFGERLDATWALIP
ncbi:MAG: papain-like cysteine protease family protein [Acidobacteriota bacterium]